MSGLCGGGCIRNIDINEMINELQTTPNVERKDIFTDELVSISQVSLKANLFKSYNKNDIVIFVEGYCYNIEELNLLFKTKYETFQEFIYWAYNKNCLKDFFNKVDGYFHAAIYDKIKKKIFLISDRLGTRFLFFYYKDGVFAFSGEVKGILAIKDIDREIDKNSFECFVNGGSNFYLLNDNTMFKNIKLLNPSTILEYDIKNNILSQQYYWKFSEIKKTNISYEDSIDILHNLIEDAVLKRISKIDLSNAQLPLSGGLDSRLIFAILDKYDKMPAHIFTNGTKDCTDVVFAKRLCKKFGYKHSLNLPMGYSNYIENGKDYPWETDGMLIYIEQGIYKPIEKYHYGLCGYVGDMVFGETFKQNSDFLDQRINATIAKHFYGEYCEFSDYNNDFYNIDKIEPHLFMNRVRRYTAQMLNYGNNYNEYLLPFIDNKIIEFVYSIPDEYRAHNHLYADLLLKFYPEYYNDIPWNKYNLPIQGRIYKNNKKNINALMEKIENLNFLSKKRKNSIKKRININNLIYKHTFHVYDKELSNDLNIKYIKENYINSNSILKNYVSYSSWKDIEKFVEHKNAWKIALILTAEFYLRSFSKKYLN